MESNAPSRSAGAVPPEVAPVRQGEELDWHALDAYLRTEIPELSGAFEVLQFPNGSANLTYLVRVGDRSLVVRRPPFGAIAPGAHDMKREFRTLSRLWRAFPPRPARTPSATITPWWGRTSWSSSTARAS